MTALLHLVNGSRLGTRYSTSITVRKRFKPNILSRYTIFQILELCKLNLKCFLWLTMKSKSTLEEKLNFKVLINGSRHFIVKLSKSFKKTTEHQHFSNSISIWFKTKAPDVDATQNLRSCLCVFVDTLKRRGHNQQAAHPR